MGSSLTLKALKIFKASGPKDLWSFGVLGLGLPSKDSKFKAFGPEDPDYVRLVGPKDPNI